MKCPQCSLSTSDNRDSCPQCGLDLRTYKVRLGIRSKPRPAQTGVSSGSSAPTSVGSGEQSGSGIHDAPVDFLNDPFDELTEELESEPSIEDVRRRRRERRQAIVPAKAKADVSDLVSAFEEFGAGPASSSPSGAQPTDAPAPRQPSRSESWISEDDLLQEESIEPLAAIEASISDYVDEARRSTQKLQESFTPPVTEPTSAPNRRADSTVSPEVLDFSDEDDFLEERLDQMIGDIMFDVEAVKVEKPKKPAPEQLVYDDVEISFEIEVEDDDEDEDEDDSDARMAVENPSEADFGEIAEPVLTAAPEVASPPSEHDAILEDLMSSFESIESQTSYRAIAPESEAAPAAAHPAVSFEPRAQAPTFTPSAQLSKEERIKNLPESVRATLRSAVKSNDPAIERLAALLGEAYGVAPEDLLESDSISNLQAELASELDALMSEGMSFLPSASAPATAPAQPAQPDRDPRIESLESELLEQLNALQADGMSFLGTADDPGTTGSFKAALQQSGLVAPDQSEQPPSKSLNTDLEQELRMLSERGTTVHSSLVGPKPQPEITAKQVRPSSVSVSPGVAGVLSSLKNAVSSQESHNVGRVSRSSFPQPSVTLSNSSTGKTPSSPIHSRAIRPELPPVLARSLAARAAELAGKSPTGGTGTETGTPTAPLTGPLPGPLPGTGADTVQQSTSDLAPSPAVDVMAHAALSDELDALLSAELDGEISAPASAYVDAGIGSAFNAIIQPSQLDLTSESVVQVETAVLEEQAELPEALTESTPLTQAEQALEDLMTEPEDAIGADQGTGWTDAVQTGTFLLSDLQSIDSEISELEPNPSSDSEELADEIADLFDQLSEQHTESDSDEVVLNATPTALLDEAVHTGTFLLSDFETLGGSAEQEHIATDASLKSVEADSSYLESSPEQDDSWVNDLTSEIDELASLVDELVASEGLVEEELETETEIPEFSDSDGGETELEPEALHSLHSIPQDNSAEAGFAAAPPVSEIAELDSELARLLDDPLTEDEPIQLASDEVDPQAVEPAFPNLVQVAADSTDRELGQSAERSELAVADHNTQQVALDRVQESVEQPAAETSVEFYPEVLGELPEAPAVDAAPWVDDVRVSSELDIQTPEDIQPTDLDEAQIPVEKSSATETRIEQAVQTGSFLIADFAALEQLSVAPIARVTASPESSFPKAIPIEQLPPAAVIELHQPNLRKPGLEQTVQTGAFLIADLAALQSEVATQAVAEQQALERAGDAIEPSLVVDEPVAPVRRNRLEETVQTGTFLVNDLATVEVDVEVDSDPDAADEAASDEIDSTEFDVIEPEPSIKQARAQRLEDLVHTGTFLVGDFQALSPEESTPAPVQPKNPVEEDEAEPEYADVSVELDAATQSQTDGDRKPGNTTSTFLVSDFARLDESPRSLTELVNTGVFLVEDLQAIDLKPEQPPAPFEKSVLTAPTGATSVADALWGQAAVQLVPVEEILGEEIELGLGNLGTGQVDDRLLVLFYATDEELIDPSKRERHQRTIPTSEARKVESSSLTSAVKQFQVDQKVFVETQRQLAEEYAANPNPAREVFNVPLWKRIVAGIVDGLVVLLGGLAAAWALFLPTEALIAAYTQGLFVSGVGLQYGFQILLTCYIVWIVTTWAMVATHGRTLGGKLLQLEVVSMRGYPPTVKHALLRALSQPLTLLTAGLGMLPALGSRRLALHDYLSKTQIVEYDFFVEQERRRALHVPQEYLIDDIDG